MATFTVNTLVDENDGIGVNDVSLRDAINEANNTAGADTIVFDPSLNGTINLNQAQLIILESVAITGLGANVLTVDAGGESVVFKVDDGDFNPDETVAISGLTITGGNGGSSGGGISNQENLTITDSIITGNTAFMGGGLNNQNGTVNINNSTISDNTASQAGGLFNDSGSTATISNSTISNNQASSTGGAIFNATAIIIGGGLIGGTVNLSNSTVTGNSANFDSGISSSDGGTFIVTSSIVAGNANDTDAGGSVFYPGGIIFNSGGNNLIGNGDSAPGFTNGVNGDLVGTAVSPIDPLLGPLQDNGGPTATHELLSGSPAIDAGSNPDSLVYDQRGLGFARVVGPSPDIGAFEVQPSNQPPDAVDDNATTKQDTAVNIDVLANDSDPDSDPLAIDSYTQGADGSVTLDDNSTPGDTTDDFLVYTPDTGFGGLDSFTYNISDGNGGTDTATVNLSVYPYILEDNGELFIIGTNGKDEIKVEEQSNGDVKVVVDAKDEGIKLEETIPGPIDKIIVNSLDANDKVEVKYTSIDSEQFGGPGNDTLKGDDGNDILYGEAGDDKLEGKDGEDTLYGGAGDDELKGGHDDDTLYGGAGADTLDGEYGNDSFIIEVFDEAEYDIFDGGSEDLNTNPNGDTIINASGTDVILNEFREGWEIETFEGNGNAILGNDLDNILDFRKTTLQNVTFVDGGLGDDEIKGTSSDDDLRGGDGEDKLEGKDGDDTLFGGAGDDELEGEDGNDNLFGGAGADTLKGEDGDDNLFGGAGADTLKGEDGDDSLSGNTGNDKLEGGKGIDILSGTDSTAMGVGEIDELKGGDGADTFVLGDADNVYYKDDGFDYSLETDTGYVAEGEFSYDGNPAVVSESGPGQTNYLQSLSLSVFDSANNLLDSGNSVVDSISNNNFFLFEFDTLTGTMNLLDASTAESGNDPYYFVSNAVVPPDATPVTPGSTDFNLFEFSSSTNSYTFLGSASDIQVSNNVGDGDYALITDFTTQDVIQLNGTAADYVLDDNYTLGSSSGTAIFLDETVDELIGFVKGVTGLDLNSNDFSFISSSGPVE